MQVDCINRESTASNAAWFPILRDVTGLGASLGEQVPRAANGVVILHNNEKSLGAERRISDLLDTHTLQDREVRFYVANLPIGTDPTQTSDLTEVWRATCIDCTFDNNFLRVNFSKSVVPTRTITRTVTRDAFPDAPETSYGKHLPLIFGNFNEVDAVQVRKNYTASSENRIDIAYGTSIGNKFIPSGTGSDAPVVFFFNTITNRYEPVTFASAPATPIYSQPSTGTSAKDFWEFYQAEAYQLRPTQNVTGGELISGVNFYLANQADSATPPVGEGQYTCTVYANANGYPGQEIAKSVVEIGSPRIQFLGVINGAYVFTLRFYFDRLVQIPLADSVFIAFTKNDRDDLFAPFKDVGTLSPFEKYRIFSVDYYDVAAGETPQTEFERVITTTNKLHFDVFGIAVTHDVSGGSSSTWQDGLGHVQLTLRMRDQDQVPDLSRESFVITSRGLKDDASGSITGSPNSLLSSGIGCMAALRYNWDGSNWVAGASSTKFSATWARGGFHTIRGSTQGRYTQVAALEELAFNSAARIVPTDEGRTAIYYMGIDRPVAGVIDDETARLVNVEVQGRSNMVNRFESVYYRRITQRIESLLNEGGFYSYQGAFDSRFDSVNVPSSILNNSIARFGSCELGVKEFNFISDLESMRTVASYYLRAFMLPQVLITFEVPFFKHGHYQIMDKVDLYFTGLPAIDGTTHDAQLPVSADTGNNSVELTNGHYWKRQKKYRCIIMGKDVILSKNEQPTVRFFAVKVNDGALL